MGVLFLTRTYASLPHPRPRPRPHPHLLTSPHLRSPRLTSPKTTHNTTHKTTQSTAHNTPAHRRLGMRPTGKSFRFVSCVRAVCLSSEIGVKKAFWLFPFPFLCLLFCFFVFPVVPFSLCCLLLRSFLSLILFCLYRRLYSFFLSSLASSVSY